MNEPIKIKENRISGVYLDDYSWLEEDLEYNEFLDMYDDFENFYSKFVVKVKKIKCYVVTYVDVPGIVYVGFDSRRDKVKGDATKYFKESGHPQFINRQWRTLHLSARCVQKPEWDKYAPKKRVPVKEFLKVGAKFPCGLCGRHLFTYQDYRRHKCIITEGEGQINPFTDGYILCKECAGL